MTNKPQVLQRALSEINPLDAEVLACPHQFNEKLRAEAPIYHCPITGIYYISNYETIVRMGKDHETFSNKFSAALRPTSIDPDIAAIQAEGYPNVDTMLTQDPPEQRRYRNLVNQAFTIRRVNSLEPYIEELCHSLIDSFADKGECDFVESFCIPLPVTVIADQLGVPRDDLALFKEWSDAFVAQLSQQATKDELIKAAQLVNDYQKYFVKKLEETRENPTDNILSDIVNARMEGERPLDTTESLSIIQQLLVAGNETTTNTLADGMLLLIQNPDQRQLLEDDPSLIENFVEEALRLSSPTANMWRIVKKDAEVEGVNIPEGSIVMLRYSSGNRDEQQFADGGSLDVRRRNAKSNLAFGHGVHMCIGASLARKELNVAFRVLLQRLSDVEVAIPEQDIFYPPNVLLRGMASLPIKFRVK